MFNIQSNLLTPTPFALGQTVVVFRVMLHGGGAVQQAFQPVLGANKAGISLWAGEASECLMAGGPPQLWAVCEGPPLQADALRPCKLCRWQLGQDCQHHLLWQQLLDRRLQDLSRSQLGHDFEH